MRSYFGNHRSSRKFKISNTIYKKSATSYTGVNCQLLTITMCFRQLSVRSFEVMSLQHLPALLRFFRLSIHPNRFLSTTATCQKNQSGRYRPTTRKNFPLTYEMANPPHYIAHRKTWNSWNTSNLEGGLRASETGVEDAFIRKFVVGTCHGLFVSEIIIKRQHNVIRIAGLIRRSVGARKVYFLIGYTEELLSFWLQCPVKIELQTVAEKSDVVFKYI